MTRRSATRDAGATMAELLVVVILIAILAGAAIPFIRAQQHRSLDDALAGDLRRYGAAAERAYSANFTYPTTPAGFAMNSRGVPTAGAKNTFRAFVIPSGSKAGYVLYGRNDTTGHTYLLSSYEGGAPRLLGTTSLPLYPPVGGTYGIPASVVPADWAALGGTYWGDKTVWNPTAASYPVMPYADPTFQLLNRPTPSTAPTAQVYGYYSPAWRVVDLVSPVSDRAIEIVTDSATNSQGVIMLRQPMGPTWPATQIAVAAAGERWTVSAFVKAPSGTSMSLGCRYMTAPGVYVSENSTTFTANGTWQRPGYACAATETAMVGTYVEVQVYTNARTPGTTFYVTGPQVNKGTSTTAFEPQ